MSAALPVAADLLRVGYNELIVEAGQAIPDLHVPGNAWDELLFRRVRLVRVEPSRSQGVSLAPVLPLAASPVTLTVVYDNNAYVPELETAWGFACVVQHGGGSILFDTGGDGRMLLANMAAMNLDPSDLDAVVLSHAHGDHTGGLDAVLKANPRATVYLPQAFPDAFKSQVRAQAAQVVEVKSPLEIQPGVWSTGQIGNSIEEQALVVQTGSGLTVITGCAHPGIVEVVRRAREVGRRDIDLVIGGFHLSGESAATLRSVVFALGELGIERIAPCHCTGEIGAALIASAFGEGYQRCGAGLVLREGE